MDETIIGIWSVTPTVDQSVVVVPDGCRDIVFRGLPYQKSNWFITDYFDQTTKVDLKKNCFMAGYRLKAGTQFDHRILEVLQGVGSDLSEAEHYINELTYLPNTVAEILNCLASDFCSVKEVSKLLGTNIRTLQRNCLEGTGKSPSYWLKLARVRKAAKMISSGEGLCNVAIETGYYDQSHMNRQFKYWLKITPFQLLKSRDIMLQLDQSGFPNS